MAVINPFEVNSQLGAPADNRNKVHVETSGGMAVARENMQLANTVQQGADKLYEQIVNADVMKANNEYNMRMNEVRNRLFLNKEDKAFGNMAEYEKERNKIIGDIMKNGPRSVRFGSGNAAFMTMAEKDWTNQKDIMQRYQIAEAEKYQETQSTIQLQDTLANVADSYDNPLLIDSYLNRAAFIKANQYKNYGEARMQLEANNARAAVISTAITTAIGKSDYDNASYMLEKYGGLLDSKERTAFTKNVYAYKEMEYENNVAEMLVKLYDGNEEAIVAAIDNNEIPGYNFDGGQEGKNWERKDASVSLEGIQENTKSGLADLSMVYQNMSGEKMLVTSGTDSGSLHAAGARSHGGGWKVDIASDWLADPNNRKQFIKAAESKGIVVIDEYSNPSKNSTGGHLDLDFTDYTGVKTGLNFMQKKAIKDNVKNIISDNKRRKNAQKAQLMEQISQDIYDWKNGGVSYAEAMQRINQYGEQYKDAEMVGKLKNMVSSVYTPETGELWDETEIVNMIKSNRWQGDGEAFMQFVASNFGGKNVVQASKLWNEYLQGKGAFAFDNNALKLSVMGKSSLSQAEAAQWHGAQLAMNDYRIDFIKKNGREPSYNEMTNAGKAAITKNNFGSYRNDDDFFATDIEASRAELYNAGIRDIQAIGSTELNRKYRVTFTDGTTREMSGSELNRNYFNRED